MSAPLTAVSLPKLNLPARGPLVANGDSSVQTASVISATPASAPEQQHPHQHQPNGQPGAHHAVFLLLPGLNFPPQPPGEPPLTVGALKALCCDTLCPPPSAASSSSSSPSSPAPTPPQLEFFRLSALVRLTDDTVPAPPGIVVAGAHLMHQDLTLGLVERVVAENRGLRERAELAGEALEAFEARAERDARTIRLLRESLDTLTSQHRALQDKYAALLSSTTAAAAASSNSSSSNSSSNSHSSSFASVVSYGGSSSLAASLSSSSTTTTTTATTLSHSASLSAPASAAVSPRGVSPRLHVASGAHPHTLSQTPRTFHNSFPSLTSPRSPSRPTSAAPGTASGSALFSPRSGEGLISPATSPRRRLACRTGNCTCTAFNPQPSASWICVCGHMSLKHAGGGPP